MRMEARTSLLFAVAMIAALSALLQAAPGEENEPALFPALNSARPLADYVNPGEIAFPVSGEEVKPLSVMPLPPPPQPSLWVHPGYRMPRRFVQTQQVAQQRTLKFPAYPSTAAAFDPYQAFPARTPTHDDDAGESSYPVRQVWYQQGRYDDGQDDGSANAFDDSFRGGTATVRDPAPAFGNQIQVDINPDEAAKVIADLMESLGTRALQGTVFDQLELDEALTDVVGQPARPTPEEARAARREAITQYVRRLAQEERQQAAQQRYQSYEAVVPEPEYYTPGRTTTPGTSDCVASYCPAPAPLGETQSAHDSVATLREVSRRLDEAAHQLEHEDLYERADQLRELAAQLRGDARRTRGHQPHHPRGGLSPIDLPRQNLELEIQSLRRQVRQLERSLPGTHATPRYPDVR